MIRTQQLLERSSSPRSARSEVVSPFRISLSSLKSVRKFLSASSSPVDRSRTETRINSKTEPDPDVRFFFPVVAKTTGKAVAESISNGGRVIPLSSPRAADQRLDVQRHSTSDSAKSRKR